MNGSLLIDISRLMGRTNRGRLPTGVDRVCLAYVAHFGARAQAVLQWNGWRRILSYGTSQQLFERVQAPNGHFTQEATSIIARACLPPWPSQEGGGRVYFHLSHSGADDEANTAWLQRIGVRPLYMVYDLIPLEYPEYCRPGEAPKHEARMRGMLEAGAAIQTISEATKSELEAFATARGLRVPEILANPIAPARLARSTEPPPIAHPYFVVLGTIEPRKNHLLLLHLWRELVAQFGAAAPHLFVIGQRGWECENVVDMLERCAPLKGVVHELHGCSDADLARYLTHARALLFPSFAEGFGMPLAESLKIGTPVIATPLVAFREVAGDVPDYFDPLDGPAWTQAIVDYTRPDSPRRNAQLERLRDFEPPTWQRHFERVENLLERLK